MQPYGQEGIDTVNHHLEKLIKRGNTISPVNSFDQKQHNKNAIQTTSPQDQGIFYRIGKQSPQQC